MTDLDQNALDAACKAFAARRCGAAQAMASERDQVTRAFTVYLAARRERWLEKTAGTGSHEAVDEFLPDLVEVRGDRIIDADLYDVRRAIAIAITAAVEEEREACARLVKKACGPGESDLAETAADSFNSSAHRTVSDRLVSHGSVIAAAIRSRSSQGEK